MRPSHLGPFGLLDRSSIDTRSISRATQESAFR